MASIKKVEIPEQVQLLPGAMQNWTDLEVMPPVSPAVAALVHSRLDGEARRALVLGPHDTTWLNEIAQHFDELVVVVRAIPDAQTIAAEVPKATVLCGYLDEAISKLGKFPLILAVRDLSRLASAERGPVSWESLAKAALAGLMPEGVLLLGIESDLSPQRLGLGVNPGAQNKDADWSVLSTWDHTRPRTAEQIDAFFSDYQYSTQLILGDWDYPSAISHGDFSSLLPLVVTRRHTLQHRSLIFARLVEQFPAGWIVEIGNKAEEMLWHDTGEQVLQWQRKGDSYRRGEDLVSVPRLRSTLLLEAVEACSNNDLATLNQLVRRWSRAVTEVSNDGDIPREFSRICFDELGFDDAGKMVWLVPGLRAKAEDEAKLEALASFLQVITSQGLRHPWPLAMEKETVFKALCAVAKVAVPSDLSRYLKCVNSLDQASSRQELQGVISRQREELKTAWARVHWDEKQYAVFKAKQVTKNTAKKIVKKARNKAGKIIRKLPGRK